MPGAPVTDCGRLARTRTASKTGVDPAKVSPPRRAHHGTDSLPTTGTRISPPACVSRCAVAAALGRGGDDAARSADVRGEQLAALETEHHALLTTPKVARLLERAEAGASQLEDWPLANLREMRRQRDHAIATPPSLIARLAKATARAEVFWVEARKANDFKMFAPHLEEVVHLVRDKAALLGQARGLPPYDALVDAFTPGISTADIDTIFKALSRKLPGLINQAIEVQAARPPIPLAGKFTVARQRQLSLGSAQGLGISFRSGPSGRKRAPVHRGSPRRHPRHHALRFERSILGSSRRGSRDRACHVRPRTAAAVARSTGGA